MQYNYPVVVWRRAVMSAISAEDWDTLAQLMEQNDRNGVWSYEDCVREFGQQTRAEWAVSLRDYAQHRIGVNCYATTYGQD